MRKPIFKVALRVVRVFNSRHTHTNTCTHTHVYPEYLIVCACVCVVHIEALYRKAAIKIVVAAQGKPYAVNWHDTLPGTLHPTLYHSAAHFCLSRRLPRHIAQLSAQPVPLGVRTIMGCGCNLVCLMNLVPLHTGKEHVSAKMSTPPAAGRASCVCKYVRNLRVARTSLTFINDSGQGEAREGEAASN